MYKTSIAAEFMEQPCISSFTCGMEHSLARASRPNTGQAKCQYLFPAFAHSTPIKDILPMAHGQGAFLTLHFRH